MSRGLSILALGILSACTDPTLVVVEDSLGTGGVPPRPPPGSCDLADPAFCDTFATFSPGGRAGDLDEAVWSVARVGNGLNIPQGNISDWPPATAVACGATKTGLFSGSDTFFCTEPASGRQILAEAMDDFGGPAIKAIRARQPIDFENRTATISIDVDAKEETPGGYGWRWHIVVSEDPVPAPYDTLFSHFLVARRALVVEFQGFDCTGGDGTENQPSRIVVEDGYSIVKEFIADEIADQTCFRVADQVLNHVEIRFGVDALEVWATDLDDAATFRRVGSVSGLGLPFTRGYVSFEHASYNAGMAGLPSSSTYHIGSFGFDGPSVARPRAYEIADALTPPGNAPADHKNFGYVLAANGAPITTCCDWVDVPSLAFHGVNLAGATSGRLNLNVWGFHEGMAIGYRFNGGATRSFAHPFVDSEDGARAITIPVDVADLVAGDDTLELWSEGSEMIAMNIELEVVP